MNTPARTQRGVGTLAVAMLLLFASSIVVFYLNRSLIFEQKTSANQLRSTTAFEAAEAGLEWATGMLNNANDISAACLPDASTNVSFRKMYAMTNFPTTTDIVPDAAARPGCVVNASGTLTCSCPSAPNSGVTSLTNTTPLPGFTVAFAAVTNPATGAVDDDSLEVTSTGCSAIAGPCNATTAVNSDATASVRAIVKLSALLRSAPAAALTCGSSCIVDGSFTVVNTDLATNGITVNSGTTTSTGSGPYPLTTIAGIPPRNSVVANDPTLSSISASDPTCSQDRLFNAYFGTTVAQYAAAPTTKTITCATANACGTQVDAAMKDGWRSFFFTKAPNHPTSPSFELTTSAPFASMGTASDPVTIVTEGNIRVNATIDIYGLVYSDSADLKNLGTGNSRIFGAMIACADFDSNGNGLVSYNGDVLKNAQRISAVMVRVPGSWRDFD